MKYGAIEHFQTGVAIPVSGLKSQSSCGIGEFLDLIPLAQWAKQCAMDLIQILPINDTGECSSPYSALSAFALNPVYLNLDSIAGALPFGAQIQSLRESALPNKIAYTQIYRSKMDLLAQIYALESKKKSLIQSIDTWLGQNTWCVAYALYVTFKTKEKQKPWWEWSKEHKTATPVQLDEWQVKHKKEVRFYAWVQMQCESQMARVAQELNALGIRLKGDIPILINEDSADAWGYPELFDMKNRAGAPPDMFCYSGQNWGFPCYQWSVLKKQNYRWWRERLQRASKFYHAFRIDHVLGFFRIWQVPVEHRTGMLGRFVPSIPLKTAELKKLGFTESDLEILSHAYFSKAQLEDALAPTGLKLEDYFRPSKTLWTFKPEFATERSLDSLNLTEEQKGVLITLMWNRVLLKFQDEAGSYYPYWYYYNSPSFHRLDCAKQDALRRLFGANASAQEPFWEKNGEELLRMMSTETDMLVCAEDLGVVPQCVAPVLERLNILSLKIERWARDWSKEGSPFIPLSEYPRLSVNSPSCHDTSTLRGWWEEEWDKQSYVPSLGLTESEAPKYLTTELARQILARNLGANSLVCLFPLQDWLSLHYDLREEEPVQGRINVPGTLGDDNWSWRMKDSLEHLIHYGIFNQQVRELVEERKNRPL